ncbi:PITH domain-containing protein GA19395 [Anthonomus grandis grandis]|uniref:PITH domain-containing protein GA19395 n=1 Tax=Anthonomus grandis grandis TaxID=2921223 RepID=UPI002165F9F4|nr:PITH domain-containing protein GA19395 [Anthonomus grandis grandis]
MPPHGSGKCCGDSSHQHEEPEKGIQYSLYTKINMSDLECLNESVEGSGKTVFKPWEERLERTRFVESDVDEELLFNIPFTGNIKLKGIIVIGENTDSYPSKMRLFKNRPFMTFDDTSAAPDQEFELQKDTEGELEYATKVTIFSNVNHLSIHFPGNFGDEHTKINYIGLKGEFSEAHRHGVTICNYELRPNVADHAKTMDNVSREIS